MRLKNHIGIAGIVLLSGCVTVYAANFALARVEIVNDISVEANSQNLRGSDGADGAQGDDGADGTDGARGAAGKVIAGSAEASVSIVTMVEGTATTTRHQVQSSASPLIIQEHSEIRTDIVASVQTEAASTTDSVTNEEHAGVESGVITIISATFDRMWETIAVMVSAFVGLFTQAT